MISPIDLQLCFKKVYKESFLSYPYADNGLFNVSLKEAEPQSKIKEIVISNVPKNTILLNLHEYSKLTIGNQLKNIFITHHEVFI